jgi:DNA-binding CsgD family transcriptional regulator
MNITETNSIDTGLSSITPREMEILYWIAEGRGSKEIAACLHLSVHTVQKHTKNIYRKLDVHNKIEALNKTKWLIASLYRNQN